MKNTEQSAKMVSSPDNYIHEDEISLFELLSVMWGKRYFIVFSVILCISIATAYLLFTNSTIHETSAVFSLNFSGIEKHKNPDGTNFDMQQILKPSILSKISFFDNETQTTTQSDKIDLLNIKPLIPESVLNQIEKEPTTKYFPNMFLLSIKTNDEIYLSNSKRSELLTQIIKEYHNDFIDKYIDINYFAENLPENFLLNNDYNEVLGSLSTIIGSNLNIIDKKIKISGNYKSINNNLSFLDVKTNLGIIRNIELSRAKSLVDNFNLTKNKTVLIAKLKQKIVSLETQMNKAKARAQIAETLLKKVNTPETNSGLKIPKASSIDASFIETLRKEDSISFLLKTILSSQSTANDHLIEIQKVKENIKKLEADSVNSKNGENIILVESFLQTLIQKYKSIIIDANILNNEFLNLKYADSIKIEQPPISTSIKEKNSLLIISLSGIASLFVAIFAAFLIEYIKNESSAQQPLIDQPNNSEADESDLTELNQKLEKFNGIHNKKSNAG